MEYGLVGRTLTHSYSPRIHALLSDYRYELFELTEEQLHAFLSAREFKGVNVTIPYKRAAYERCDDLSDEARALGNVNTLIVRDGRLIGHNTDLYGFLRMVELSGISVQGKKVAVLGSGGAASTARAALQTLGAKEVVTVSRRGPVDYAALYRDHADAQVLVNATPVGMYPHTGASPVELERLPAVSGVLDMVYNPARTRLMLDAEARGIRAANGLHMLVAQAARASELFTGRAVRDDAVSRIAKTVAREQMNVVLIGMPGSGKSSIGARLAERMGRAFVDIDTHIEREAGMSIPEVFARYGEARFRQLEAGQIHAHGVRHGLVIATGGGSVMDPANVDALRQNGELILVERPLELLASEGRPLSKDMRAIRALYDARLPVYERVSRARVHNTGTIDEAACAAQEVFHELAGD